MYRKSLLMLACAILAATAAFAQEKTEPATSPTLAPTTAIGPSSQIKRVILRVRPATQEPVVGPRGPRTGRKMNSEVQGSESGHHIYIVSPAPSFLDTIQRTPFSIGPFRPDSSVCRRCGRLFRSNTNSNAVVQGQQQQGNQPFCSGIHTMIGYIRETAPYGNMNQNVTAIQTPYSRSERGVTQLNGPTNAVTN